MYSQYVEFLSFGIKFINFSEDQQSRFNIGTIELFPKLRQLIPKKLPKQPCLTWIHLHRLHEKKKL
jgi:hypothetical protein